MRQRAWWVGCTVLVAACSGGDGKDGPPGTDGLNALVATTVVEPGEDCVAGGYEVRSGQDADGDGKLSAEETLTTDYVCHGEGSELGSGGAGAAGGLVSLVSVTTLAPGDECKAGGLRLEAGLDADDSGSLEAGEVTTSRALCHGEPGEAANQGDPGLNSLIVTHPEAAGNNCASGGTRIDVGQDADRDATLSEAEVSSTSYVCNGEAGPAGPVGPSGLSSLLVVAPEPAGPNCAYGGSIITTGLDDGEPSGTPGNGVLEPGEVNAAATTFLCRPEPSLEDLLEAAGQAVSLSLTGPGVSAEFAIVEHLGSENDVVEVTQKGGGTTQKLPGTLRYTPVTLQGRFTSKELTELVAWRTSLEASTKGIADFTLTATDRASKKAIATWELADAWPASLEVKELPSGGDPVVTVTLSYSGLTRSTGDVPVVMNAVTLDSDTFDSNCASVSGIGSESEVVTITTKVGGTVTVPGALDVFDPVCARPVDGSAALYDWRRLTETAKTMRSTMVLTLPDKSAFQFAGAWPRSISVDTGPSGKLEETVIFVHSGFAQTP